MEKRMAEFSKLVITNKGQALIAKMIAGEGRLTKENYEARLQNMYDLSERIVNEYILEYYSK